MNSNDNNNNNNDNNNTTGRPAGRPPAGRRPLCVRCALDESRSLGLERQVGGKFHLKLNVGSRPIANKYREGKMKRTLKRELKVLETVKG